MKARKQKQPPHNPGKVRIVQAGPHYIDLILPNANPGCWAVSICSATDCGIGTQNTEWLAKEVTAMLEKRIAKEGIK